MQAYPRHTSQELHAKDVAARKNGKTYYEAQVQKSGGEKAEIKVAEDGTLINVGKEEEEDDDD